MKFLKSAFDSAATAMRDPTTLVPTLLGSGTGGILGAAATGSVMGTAGGMLAFGAATAAATTKTGSMYVGGAALGGLAGGTANLMFGEEEDFGGAVSKGALVGLGGGIGIRSLTSSQGFLNRAGQAIGANLDEAGKASRTKKLAEYETKLNDLTEGSDEYKALVMKRDALEKKEVGGIRRFFLEMGETADERTGRVLSEYEGLQRKAGNVKGKEVGASTNRLTEADEKRLAQLESQFGAEMQQVDATEEVLKYRTMRPNDQGGVVEADMKAFKKIRRDPRNTAVVESPKDNQLYSGFRKMKMADGSEATELQRIKAYTAPEQEFMNSGGATDFAEGHSMRGLQIGYIHDRSFQKVAGYNMQNSDAAARSISSRNTNLMLGGAGLTGFAVGATHSSGRRKHRRGFNKNRGTRF